MGNVFGELFRISFAASWLIIAVLVLRILLRRSPKWIICLLWGMVAIRLILPFSIESSLSLVPSPQSIQTYYDTNVAQDDSDVSINDDQGDGITPNQNIIVSDTEHNQDFAHDTNDASAHIISSDLQNDNGNIRGSAWEYYGGIIWCAGLVILLIYSIVSYFNIKSITSEAICLRDNIYIGDYIKSPFISGLFKGRIYLPSGINENQMKYILEHEETHLRRGDNRWKAIGYLLLCVYWFNPLSWAAYIMFCRDIELACDERVILSLDLMGRKEYSNTLLETNRQNKLVLSYPLAFAESGLKVRVKAILHYKKPTVLAIIGSIAVCVVVLMCFLTNQRTAQENSLTASKATVTMETFPGFDGAKLDYADEDIVIFHGNYGLFVYNYTDEAMVTSLDLSVIGCDGNPVSESCKVSVKADGSIVYIYSISKKQMYAFSLSDNQLTEVGEDIDPDTLFGQLVEPSEYFEKDHTIFTSDDAAIVTANHEDKLIWLESGSGMPIDLCVLTGNVVEGKTVDEQNRNYIRIFRTE